MSTAGKSAERGEIDERRRDRVCTCLPPYFLMFHCDQRGFNNEQCTDLRLVVKTTTLWLWGHRKGYNQWMTETVWSTLNNRTFSPVYVQIPTEKRIRGFQLCCVSVPSSEDKLACLSTAAGLQQEHYTPLFATQGLRSSIRTTALLIT